MGADPLTEQVLSHDDSADSTPMKQRPYWTGKLRLSLVTLDVEVYSALNRSKQVALHEIYKPTGERVHRSNIAGDKTVDRSDIVKGYEFEKNQYVIIEPKEIDALKVPSKKVLDIVEFVPIEAIDEVYFEAPYYIVPQDAHGDDAFFIIRDALRKAGKAGLGQLSVGGRERLCAIKPYGSAMILETLRYEDEVRSVDPFFDGVREKKPDAEQLDLALELIKRKSVDFKPGKFHDHYREALQALIDAKVQRKPAPKGKKDQPEPKMSSLMDALRASLNEPAASNKKSTSTSRRATTSPRKPTTRAKARSTKPRNT